MLCSGPIDGTKIHFLATKIVTLLKLDVSGISYRAMASDVGDASKREKTQWVGAAARDGLTVSGADISR